MTGLPQQATSDTAASAVGDLSDNEVAKLSEVLASLIQARESGIRYAETRLNSLALLSGGLIAAGIALLSMGLDHSGAARPVLLTGSVGLLALAMGLLLGYARSTNPSYPFIDKKRTDIAQARWKWFYWDALPAPREFASMGKFGRQSEASRGREIEQTNEQFPEFVERLVDGVTDAKTNTAEDIRQLYTLHINERFKNQYLTNLRWILQRGLQAVLGLVLISGVVAALWATRSDETSGRFSSTDGSLYFTVDWREEGRSDGLVTLRVELRMHNRGRVDEPISILSAQDENGVDLPLVSNLSPTTIGARGADELDVEVIVPASYVEAVDSWGLG